MSLRRIKQRLAQAFLIALLLFGLWQIPLSAWLNLWQWLMVKLQE